MDYEVFEPENERLAKIIVRFLQERGYSAGYQLGYPKNKIFIRVNTKEEANRISEVITGFMEKIRLPESEITFDELDKSINIPKRTLTEAENVANLGTQAEPEPEEPEPEEPEPEEPEPEEPEIETTLELEPESETEPEESEPKSVPELEPEPEPKMPEPEQISESEKETELEEPETVSELEPEPEPEEPEIETTLEIEPEPEKPESEPIPELEPEPKETEPVQKKKKPEEEQFSFKTF
jgi:hypothetical protein